MENSNNCPHCGAEADGKYYAYQTPVALVEGRSETYLEHEIAILKINIAALQSELAYAKRDAENSDKSHCDECAALRAEVERLKPCHESKSSLFGRIAVLFGANQNLLTRVAELEKMLAVQKAVENSEAKARWNALLDSMNCFD